MGKPKLKGAEEGEDRFEREVGPVESDGCGLNPSSTIHCWVPYSCVVAGTM